MNILALEFSSDRRSVAVVQGAFDRAAPLPCPVPAELEKSSAGPGGVGVAKHRANQPLLSEIVETGRAGNALGMIEAALREAKLEREQIEYLAIGVGPGSYTGIRLAIALAQGWQLASGRINVLAIGSAECLVAQAQADGLTGRVTVAIDAQRNEFYLADYVISPEHYRETKPLRLATRAEADAARLDGSRLIGPEVTNSFADGRLIFPRAAVLAQLALTRSNFVPAEKIEPIYLRESTFVKAPPPRPTPET